MLDVIHQWQWVDRALAANGSLFDFFTLSWEQDFKSFGRGLETPQMLLQVFEPWIWIMPCALLATALELH